MKRVLTPQDLYLDQLLDLHSMEAQLSLSIPKIAPTIADKDLRDLLLTHVAESDLHLEYLETIFSHQGLGPSSDTCQTIAGLNKGGEAHIAAAQDEATRDLMIIAHCLRVEHYEIAAYEITKALAEGLGHDRDATLLNKILEDEIKSALALVDAQPKIFAKAMRRTQAVGAAGAAPLQT